MVARHGLVPEAIEHIALEMNYLETLYPSPRFPRPPAPDGNGFGRTAYMLAHTVVTGDYPVLEQNVEDPRDSGAVSAGQVSARVTALQRRVDIIGAFGRPCFAPRLTFVLRDGRRVTGEYHGRELMWDFARDAEVLRRFVPGLPIPPAQYDRLVAAIAKLETAPSPRLVLEVAHRGTQRRPDEPEQGWIDAGMEAQTFPGRVVLDEPRSRAIGQAIGPWILPAPGNIPKDGQVARLVLGGRLPASPSPKPARHQSHVLAATQHERGLDPMRPAQGIDDLTLGAFAVHGVENHQARSPQRALQASGHLLVGAITQPVVGLDVDGEAARAPHPLRHGDAQGLINVAAADQHATGMRVKPSRRRRLSGGGQSAQHENVTGGAGRGGRHRGRSLHRTPRP